jgi:hypothetical protein
MGVTGNKKTIGKGQLGAPEPLGSEHDLLYFSSGEANFDNWLKQRALKKEGSGSSRTNVVCTTEHKVIAYHCLATGVLAVAHAPGKVKRNLPDPIPVMIIGRLAVH